MPLDQRINIYVFHSQNLWVGLAHQNKRLLKDRNAPGTRYVKPSRNWIPRDTSKQPISSAGCTESWPRGHLAGMSDSNGVPGTQRVLELAPERNSTDLLRRLPNARHKKYTLVKACECSTIALLSTASVCRFSFDLSRLFRFVHWNRYRLWRN
jgi:hypothetical protein